MYGQDLVFTAEVECPVCGKIWEERIAADVEGIQCLQCRTWLEVNAKFTLGVPAQKIIEENKE